MADSKHPRRDPTTVIRNVSRPERRMRDLDNPTAQFPIGAMYRRNVEATRTGPGIFDEVEDETELLDRDIDRDEEDDVEFLEPPRRMNVDLWFFALWLAAAGVLGVLAAAAATAAVLYR